MFQVLFVAFWLFSWLSLLVGGLKALFLAFEGSFVFLMDVNFTHF